MEIYKYFSVENLLLIMSVVLGSLMYFIPTNREVLYRIKILWTLFIALFVVVTVDLSSSIEKMFIIIALFAFIFVFIRTRTKSRNEKYEIAFICIDLIYIVTYFSLIYYLVYLFDNTQFQLSNEFSSRGGQLWNFWYYSFTVAVTYSNGLIEATGIVSQIIQVVQIIIFFFVLAKDIEKVIEAKRLIKDDRV